MIRSFAFLITAITGLLLVNATPPIAAGPNETDIIVYSATPCGIASAITAAREGATVVMIEPTTHVGGLSTSGLNTAETEHMLLDEASR